MPSKLETVRLVTLLRAFAKERLGDEAQEFRELASMSSADLYFGPFSASEFAEEDPKRKTRYPGFSKACDRLQELLSKLPSKVWVDVDGEWVTEDEPQCGECQGRGNMPDDETRCESCGGTGVDIGLELGTTYVLELEDIRAKLLGRELSSYV